ncbi:testis-expressed protein 13D [Cavia porcellus]|uniref:testis-expressed protein 13D n=1 Tax=Cavia porcellus TaxID=10141 RepID=UPI002FE24427
MAVGFGDPNSGFRHTEVIRFINNEILMNGGGQDFYLTFRSRSWSEIEDGLHNILGDQQMPRNHKRACAWSALALAVRVATGQREQHMRRVRRLKEQLGNREALSWALASELQQLRQQRDQATAQLHVTRSALQHAQNECNMLLGRLFQFERCAQIAPVSQDVEPGLQAPQLGATAWPIEQQRDVWAMGEYNRLLFENPVGAPTSAFYLPTSWVPTMPSPFPVLMPQPFPLHAPFSMRLQSLQPPAPSAFTEREMGVQFQMPPVGMYPPGLSAGGGFQEQMVPLWDQSCYNVLGGLEMLQESASGNNSLNVEHLQMPQGVLVPGESGCFRQEEDMEKSLGVAPQQDRGNYTQEPRQLWPQGMPFLGENWQYYQQEYQERPQEMVSLGNNTKYNQENGQKARIATPPGFKSIRCQGDSIERVQDDMTYLGISRSQSRGKVTEYIQSVILPGITRSHSQENVGKAQDAISLEFNRNHRDEERMQCLILPDMKNQDVETSADIAKDITLWKSWSQAVKESPKKQQPQLQNTKQAQEKKAQELQQKSDLCYTPENWVCTWCKRMNFPWRIACYKCKKIHVQIESDDTYPGQMQ